MPRPAEQVIGSDLALDVYARAKGHLAGDYLLLGKTPGTVRVPAGFVPVLCPRGIAQDWASYAELWKSQALEAVYFCQVRDSDLLRRFITAAGNIQHIIAEHCGWSLSYLAACPQLEWLELHSEVHISDIRCISQLRSLRGLVVMGCNNVFSAGIPKHDTLSVLVLRNIASLQNCHKLVERVGSSFPSLQDLQLNAVGYSGSDLDLSPLQRLGHPVRLQAVGTRVTDDSGLFAAYCKERGLIEGYIDALPEDATEAYLGWAAVHRDDLAALAGDRQRLRKIELRACRDLVSLDDLTGLPELSFLRVENCKGIPSLASLAKNRTLQELTIHGCDAVSDYQCLSSCRALKRLTIKGGAGGELSERKYAQQMASLHIELPAGCYFNCDVSEDELTAILEEVPQYLGALKRELAHLGTHVGHGGRNGN